MKITCPNCNSWFETQDNNIYIETICPNCQNKFIPSNLPTVKYDDVQTDIRISPVDDGEAKPQTYLVSDEIL